MTVNDNNHNEPTLFVDLDGTLISGDTLVISLRELARHRPWSILLLPFFVLRGRAAFKAHVADRVTLDPAKLPYRHDVLEFLKEEKTRGRTLILATAAHRSIGEPVAAYLGIFDDVMTSDRVQNLKGRGKLDAILERVDNGSFDYMGDSTADIPLFEKARESLLVNPTPALLARVKQTCRVGRVFD